MTWKKGQVFDQTFNLILFEEKNNSCLEINLSYCLKGNATNLTLIKIILCTLDNEIKLGKNHFSIKAKPFFSIITKLPFSLNDFTRLIQTKYFVGFHFFWCFATEALTIFRVKYGRKV